VATQNEILVALERVFDPELKRSVVELDMVRDVGIDGDTVSLTIALTVPGCPLRARTRRSCRCRASHGSSSRST
jgi:ATP-binding protein involved in chromosome partitioning